MTAPLHAARPRVWSEPGRTTRELTTGGWRTHRPVWIEATAPCRAACPAGEAIPLWIERARAGDWAAAWALIREDNPFPAVTGRVCAHPCETACNRASWDGAVAVNALERFVGDWGLAHGHVEPPAARRPERVAVIGGGPAGLTCAVQLARFGYQVTIFEAEAELGGTLRYGIPPYRLPRPVLDGEIELALALGITVRTRTALSGQSWERGVGGVLQAPGEPPWDAVFLATGATLPLGLDVPGSLLPGVRDGLAFLWAVGHGDHRSPGRRVAVVGGGSTAMDVARTARRLGASSVTVVALETRAAMPAVAAEVSQAMAEGVVVMNEVGVRAIREVWGGLALVVAPARLGRTADGSIVPVFGLEPETVLHVDRVLLALGQRVDLSSIPPDLRARSGRAAIMDDGATARPRVFAGGDLAAATRTVAHAIGSGTRAARAIHHRLSAASAAPSAGPRPWVAVRPDRVVAPSMIGRHAFASVPRAARRERLPALRAGSFVEVVDGLAEPDARVEAARCFTCGHCIGCDVCLAVCPDMAIGRGGNSRGAAPVPLPCLPLHDGPAGYVLSTEHCKGCGLCARECPRGALVMEEAR